MIDWQENVSLKKLNTLRMDVSARYFVSVSSVPELREFLSGDFIKKHELFVLGGGSNVFFSQDFRGVVLKINLAGKRIVGEDEDFVHLEVGAGEDWPALVEYVVARGWGGIENLAMVPGTAGAAPVQNIACYGHNLHEAVAYVDAISIAEGLPRRFTPEECRFGYRTSIFKDELRNRYVIVGLCLKLRKKPILNTSYKSRYESVENELSRMGGPPYGVRDVFRAIVNIRTAKLPDIEKIGTVGSVFKNPLISREELRRIRTLCPDIHYYPEGHLHYDRLSGEDREPPSMVRIPAGWLIEDMGWCGKRVGNCGIWEKQAINIVNYGNATPEEYLAFVNMVKQAVYDRYSINLETEVVIV